MIDFSNCRIFSMFFNPVHKTKPTYIWRCMCTVCIVSIVRKNNVYRYQLCCCLRSNRISSFKILWSPNVRDIIPCEPEQFNENNLFWSRWTVWQSALSVTIRTCMCMQIITCISTRNYKTSRTPCIHTYTFQAEKVSELPKVEELIKYNGRVLSSISYSAGQSRDTSTLPRRSLCEHTHVAIPLYT